MNNDDMFDVQKERNVGRIKTFIERKESLRYPSYVDTEGHLVRDREYQRIMLKFTAFKKMKRIIRVRKN